MQRGQPGCIDCLELFAPHVRSWITNSQETLCATCRSLEATTELSSLASTATQVSRQLGAAASSAATAQVQLANAARIPITSLYLSGIPRVSATKIFTM